MIAIRYIASFFALALGAATIAVANEGEIRKVDPVVTRVGSGMAVNPGRIVIEGQYLTLIQEVRLDGAVLPVVRNTGHALWIEPAPRDPGFADLALAYPRGVIHRVLEFTPTVVAEPKPGMVELYVNGGAPGGFTALNYSFRLRQVPLQHTGVYYLDWLDMTSPYSGLVAATFLDDNGGAAFNWVRPTLLDQPVFFQALCTTAEGQMCYTNLAAVIHGHPAVGPMMKVK